MSMFKFNAIKSALCIVGCLSGALAQAEAVDLSRLDGDLTPLGSIRAGNEAGTIPEWTGGMAAGAAEIESNGFYHNPFADEQPLYVITAQNYQQYSDVLSEGQIARFKSYADFTMPVYQSHRSTAFPQAYYDKTRENQGVVSLANDGATLVDYEYGIPFAFPDKPMEVMWNHLTRFRGGSIDREFATATVASNGTTGVVSYHQWLAWREVFTDLPPGDDRLFNTMVHVLEPARYSGLVTLVQDSMDTSSNPRAAWQYNPGQRRVRRAPTLSYDTSARYSSGIVTSDGVDGFGGAPDRYDWTLVGKKEIYIPYNSGKLTEPGVQYDDVLQAGHINPDFTRFELHRVWEVQGNVKDGQRHIYAQRNFFVDEDSWMISLADHYDGRGTLWRVGEGHIGFNYQQKIPGYSIETLYDLLAGRYIALGMYTEENSAPQYDFDPSYNQFTPAALRASGVR